MGDRLRLEEEKCKACTDGAGLWKGRFCKVSLSSFNESLSNYLSQIFSSPEPKAHR